MKSLKFKTISKWAWIIKHKSANHSIAGNPYKTKPEAQKDFNNISVWSQKEYEIKRIKITHEAC